jgi:putative heme iron utilization protein
LEPQDALLLRRLLDTRPVAAFATLHRGDPAVSMVPFVLGSDGELLIHVSALATHTRDLQEHARVSLMVMAEADVDVPPQALPRVSLQAEARLLPREGSEYESAKAAYLARFPDSAITFELADFSIVVLKPVSARLVAGFGRAHALVADKLDAWLRS